MDAILFGFIGAITGSFIGVIVDRWPNGKGIINGRSRCDKCKISIAWYDMVPLISWFVLHGKCRSCGASFSFRHAGYEWAGALIWAIAAIQFNGFLLIEFSILTFLFALACFDLRHLVLPDVLTISLVILSLARLFQLGYIFDSVIAACVLFGLVALLFFFSKGSAIGFGDAKLALGIGLLFGIPYAFYVSIVAVFLGAIIGIILMITGL